MITAGKALNREWVERLLNLIKLRMPDNVTLGVRQCQISVIVERETAQTHS